MSKGEGSKIGIKFSEELVGDVSGLIPNPIGEVEILVNTGTVTRSSEYSGSYPATSVFDGNLSSYWRTSSTMPQWVQLQLSEAVDITKFKVYTSSYAPKGFELLGSNDGASFTTIITGEFISSTGWKEFTFENTTKYLYYRLKIVSVYSSRMYLYELEMYYNKPLGNENAFSVTGKQYKYINGELLDMNYKVISVEPHPTELNAILLTFDVLSRFPTVEEQLTVTYDASKGNLSGAGGSIESFTQVFTPTDLIPEPNPGIQESITVSPEIILEFLEVEYLNLYNGTETLTGAPAEPIVSLDYEYKVRKCWMEATTQLVKFDSVGQLMAESQNIILLVISKNLTSPVYTFKLVVDSVEYDGYVTVSTDKTQLTIDMANVLANFPSFTEATVKMTMVDVDLTVNDYITLYKVQEGSTDVVAFLTNEYHDVVAIYDTQSVETEQKLAQALSYVYVYQGFNDITSEYTFAKTEVSTKSLFYPTRNQMQIVKLEELNGQVTLTGTHPTLPTVSKTMTLKKDQRGLVVNP